MKRGRERVGVMAIERERSVKEGVEKKVGEEGEKEEGKE